MLTILNTYQICEGKQKFKLRYLHKFTGWKKTQNFAICWWFLGAKFVFFNDSYRKFDSRNTNVMMLSKNRINLAYKHIKWYYKGHRLWRDLEFGTWESARPYLELIEKVLLNEHTTQPILNSFISDEILCIVNDQIRTILFKSVYEHWNTLPGHFNILNHTRNGHNFSNPEDALNLLISELNINAAQLNFLKDQLNKAKASVIRMLIELIRKVSIQSNINVKNYR